MLKKIDFANPLHQFSIVLTTNLVYFIILYLCPISNYNIHPPEGAYYSDNIFNYSDLSSYLNPAKNFLEFGTFGIKNTPDYYRTIGYPAYEAALLYFFGKYFFWVAYLIQAILSALIFPIITAISNIFTQNDQRINKMVFIFLWLSGAYWIYFPALLTDMFFSFFFIIAIYYGIKTISEKKWKYCILHLLFIGYAANIRPTLILYVVPEFFILLYLAVHFNTIADKKVKIMIGVTSILLFALTNTPSFRNYAHYGVMKPSNVFEINLYDIFSKETLTLAGKGLNSYQRDSTIAANKEKVNWGDAALFRKNAALMITKSYPKETTLVFVKNFVKNLDYSHYRWGFVPIRTVKDLNTVQTTDVTDIISIINRIKEIGALLLLCIPFMLAYPIMWLLLIKHFLRKFKEKNYLYLLAIFLFLSYLFIPTLFAACGSRIRLPIDWLIVLLATVEFYHLRNIYKFKRDISINNIPAVSKVI